MAWPRNVFAMTTYCAPCLADLALVRDAVTSVSGTASCMAHAVLLTHPTDTPQRRLSRLTELRTTAEGKLATASQDDVPTLELLVQEYALAGAMDMTVPLRDIAGDRSPRPPKSRRGRGGRPESGRPVGGRPEGGRPEGGRPEGGRPEGGRPEGQRGEHKRTDERTDERSAASAEPSSGDSGSDASSTVQAPSGQPDTSSSSAPAPAAPSEPTATPAAAAPSSEPAAAPASESV